MCTYKFTYNEKDFELSKDNCDYMLNDDIQNFEISNVIDLLNKAEDVTFERHYFGDPCDTCLNGKGEKDFFEFLEYHLFAFTKDGNFVISDISKEYEITSFRRLSALKKVDNSFIVSILLCPNCGHYAIEVDQCDV